MQKKHLNASNTDKDVISFNDTQDKLNLHTNKNVDVK